MKPNFLLLFVLSLLIYSHSYAQNNIPKVTEYCADTMQMPCLVSRTVSFTYMTTGPDGKQVERKAVSADREVFEISLFVVNRQVKKPRIGWVSEYQYLLPSGQPIPTDWRIWKIGPVYEGLKDE